MYTTKDLLLMSIDGTITFRAINAAAYPGDARNLACCAALEGAAEIVMSLPEGHALFDKLAKAHEADSWIEHESRFLSRWGFYNQASPADSGFRFVAELGKLADEFFECVVMDAEN